MAVRTESEEIKRRQRWVEAWNNTMVDIWVERIQKLDIIDTGALMRSPLNLPVRADGRFVDLELSHTFLEYGLWQDLGTGREVAIGNPGDIGRKKVRQRRRWFSIKYYTSILKLRDFLALSLGKEFAAMVTNMFNANTARLSSQYYQRRRRAP